MARRTALRALAAGAVVLAAGAVVIVAPSCGRAPELAPAEALRLASTRLGEAREWHVDCRVSTYVRERRPSEREQCDMRISMRRVSYAEFIAATGDPKMAQLGNTSDYMLITLRTDGTGFRSAREVRVAFCRELHDKGGAPIALFVYNPGTPEEFFGIPQGFTQYDIFELATMMLAMALVPCAWDPDAGEYGLLAGEVWSKPGLRVHRVGDRVVATREARGLVAGDRTEVTTEIDPRTCLVKSFHVRSYANKDGKSDIIVEMKYIFSRQRLAASQARGQLESAVAHR